MDTRDEMLTIRCWSDNNANIKSRRADEYTILRKDWEEMTPPERDEEVREFLASNGHFDYGFTDPIAEAGA